jgi:hypothetical protein
MTSATRSMSVSASKALPSEVKESGDTVPFEVKMENDHESARRKSSTDAAVVKRLRGRPRKDSVQPKSEASQQNTLTSYFMVTSEPATNPPPLVSDPVVRTSQTVLALSAMVHLTVGSHVVWQSRPV